MPESFRLVEGRQDARTGGAPRETRRRATGLYPKGATLLQKPALIKHSSVKPLSSLIESEQQKTLPYQRCQQYWRGRSRVQLADYCLLLRKATRVAGRHPEGTWPWGSHHFRRG